MEDSEAFFVMQYLFTTKRKSTNGLLSCYFKEHTVTDCQGVVTELAKLLAG